MVFTIKYGIVRQYGNIANLYYDVPSRFNALLPVAFFALFFLFLWFSSFIIGSVEAAIYKVFNKHTDIHAYKQIHVHTMLD